MELQGVYSYVIKALDTNTPFSLIRIGDGECMVLSNNTYPFKRQFGFIPDHIPRIQNKIKNAYQNADIVGVPTERHKLISKYWRTAEYYVPDNTPKTSIDIHSELNESGLIFDIVKNRDVVCITGRDIKTPLEYVGGCNVTQIKITPELLFEEDKKQEPHYPNQYNKVVEYIFNNDFHGKVCLVGAGFLGKIYCDLLKNSGGVVIDMGSIFDLWAGKITRGSKKGVNSYTDEGKL